MRRASAVEWLARGACGAAALSIAGCGSTVLDPRGPIGLAESAILLDSLAIMLTIVVPTIFAILAFAWWFRAANAQARYVPLWSFSGRIELVVWAIPLMVILLLGGVAWVGSHTLDPAAPLRSNATPVEIQVVSLDWKWLFIYPDLRVASVNEVVIPAGAPVHFTLTSGSVLNAFFVPRLGSMIYTMSGMSTQLNLQADVPGLFQGLSTHFSGDGFSDMHFDVRSLAPDGFAAWADAARGSGRRLDAGRYAALARQSRNAPKEIFGSVDPDLFGKILSSEISAGSGPAMTRNDHAAVAGTRH